MNRKQIENYLENECALRDYRFKSARFWMKTSIPRSINLLNPTKQNLEDAVSVFSRDGYGVIVIYLGKEPNE